MSHHRILIVLAAGQFQGASIADERGEPVDLDLSALAAIVPTINAAAVETLATIEAEHAAELATITAQLAALTELQTTMTARVMTALQSGDPAQYEALGREFVTPEQDRIRAEKLAQLNALKAELGID